MLVQVGHSFDFLITTSVHRRYCLVFQWLLPISKVIEVIKTNPDTKTKKKTQPIKIHHT